MVKNCCLMVGNSRLHWAWFAEDKLLFSWDCDHFVPSLASGQLPREIFPPSLHSQTLENIPLYIASVVPEQTVFWREYPYSRIITLEDIPLQSVYPSLGVDRALALWGAGIKYNFPCLVVDAGTALTFTGAKGDAFGTLGERTLIGGAILPGLRLQLQSLAGNTAALPQLYPGSSLPDRWALNTEEAIASGVIYTILAGVRDFLTDWLTMFPESSVILTGGDGQLLFDLLQMKSRLIFDPHVIFWGMGWIIDN
jgi:type III pantothenate kinase